MFYLFNTEPNPQDMESRGSDTHCLPQEHTLKTGETLWLVSGELDTAGLDIAYQFASVEQWFLWRATYCETREEV